MPTANPPLPPPVTCTVCGAPLGPWAALPLVGHMDLIEDNDARCEMRNCPHCGATFAIDLGPKLPLLAPLAWMPCGEYRLPPDAREAAIAWAMFGVES